MRHLPFLGLMAAPFTPLNEKGDLNLDMVPVQANPLTIYVREFIPNTCDSIYSFIFRDYKFTEISVKMKSLI